MGGNVSSLPGNASRAQKSWFFILFALEAFFFHHPSILPASSSMLSFSSPDSEPFFKALRLKSAEASVSQCSAILLPWQKELTKTH